MITLVVVDTVTTLFHAQLIVDINGAPCGGSPFPLFFSPFEEYAELDLEPAGKAQAIDDVEKSVAARAAALERPSAVCIG